MDKLGEVEKEVSSINELNKEYTELEKKNFNDKFTLYMKTKKFP